MIAGIYRALSGIASGAVPAPPQEPAVSIKKSIAPEHIVCLEDELKFKSLKRHLRTAHGLTPDDYRQKWNLAFDYPMTAPAYAKHRSSLAKKLGLGTTRLSRKRK